MPLIKSGELDDGNLKGAEYGATVSLILDQSDPGHGPRLHRHPYDETWVVEAGSLTFTMDDSELQAQAGDIVVVPPGAAHKFVNNGPDRSKMVCIHASPKMITEWLE
jgi:mannose-6-phosphate isomerase-like protein (cupin superfamily)